jgi:hypothetical protein
MPRLAFPFLAFSLTCTGVLVAGCSGADTQDVLLQPASSSSNTNTDQTPSGSNDSSGTDTGTTGDTSTTTDCTAEEEPNDDEQHANKLAPARCGTLSNTDQKDFLTFRLKPTTQKLSITLTGRVRLRVKVDGQPTAELTPDSKTQIPFALNEDYMIEVTALTSGTGNVPWRVAVIETE